MIGGLLEKLFVAVGADLSEFKTEMAAASSAAAKSTADIAKSVDAVAVTSGTAFQKISAFAKTSAKSIGPILGEGMVAAVRAGAGRAVEVAAEKGLWEGIAAGAQAAFEGGLSEIIEGFAIQIVPQLLASTGAIGAVGTALTTLKASLLSTIPIVGAVGKAFLGLMIGPLGLIVAAVAAVVAAWYYWDDIKAIIERLGNAISEWWTANLKPTFDAVMSVVKAVADVFKDYFAAQIKNALDLVVAILSGDFKGAWEAMKGFVGAAIKAVLGIIAAFAPGAVQYLAQLYQGAKTWLMDKLGAVFEWLGRKIEAVKGFFFNLYDAVVGHSYIPDMVDGIAQHIARLDGVMVRPIEVATEKGKEAFASLQKATNEILANLFPEQSKFKDLEEQMGTLWEAFSKDLISPEVFAEAKARLEAEMADLARAAAEAREKAVQGAANDNEGGTPLITPEVMQQWGEDARKMAHDFESDFEEPVLDSIARVATGVADMVTDFAGAMDGLVRAIKDRDIVGIVQGVADVIDSVIKAIGAIKNINAGSGSSGAPPAPRATGGTTGTGGLFKVGEHGPEILRLGPGGRVYNKTDTQAMLAGGGSGGGVAGVKIEVEANPYFDARVRKVTQPQVQSAAQAGAYGGNDMTQRNIRRANERRIPG